MPPTRRATVFPLGYATFNLLISDVDNYKTQFIELAIKHQALRFGQFTLKSGRVSPYFFNAGQFHTGAALNSLASCYVDALLASGVEFDMVFGPAYKGIPLATAIVIELARRGMDKPVAFNRKEAKTHGEGGQLIGAPLAGRILLVDDVITAGTAILESVKLITDAGAQPIGILIGLDRQERLNDAHASSSQQISRDLNIPVLSVAGLDDLLTFTKGRHQWSDNYAALTAYRARWSAGTPQ